MEQNDEIAENNDQQQKVEEEKYQQINEEDGEDGGDGIKGLQLAAGADNSRRRSILEQTHDLRVLLNKIFAMRGGWKVKNLAMDFSDGFLF